MLGTLPGQFGQLCNKPAIHYSFAFVIFKMQKPDIAWKSWLVERPFKPQWMISL